MVFSVLGQSCGLCSADIYKDYVQYKQDTRVVISWLVSNSGLRHQCSSQLCIRDLHDLAESLARRKIVLPETIDFCFSAAIQARERMSKLFRARFQGSNDTDTTNHEHFTTSLRDIQQRLRCNVKSPKKQRKRRKNRVESPTSGDDTNRYKCLEGGCASNSNTDITPCPEKPAVSVKEDPCAMLVDEKEAPRLTDDTLGEICELDCAIQQTHEIQRTVKETWELAGTGSLPVVLATSVTHAAVAMFEEIEQRLSLFCDIKNPAELYERLVELMPASHVKETCHSESQIDYMVLASSLRNLWTSLLEWKDKYDSMPGQQRIKAACGAYEFSVRSKTDYSSVEDKQNLDSLVKNMIVLPKMGAMASSTMRTESPVFAEIGYFLIHRNESLRCALGLHFLFDSIRGFFSQGAPQSAFSRCRINALRLAQDAAADVRNVIEDSTFPCKCPDTFAYHLDRFHSDLQSFTSIKVWDVYVSSPWVSGSHLLDIYDALFYYGLYLMRYWNYVGCTLHIYNMLRELTDFEAIPILDCLLKLLQHEVFPGGRPSRSFAASFDRFLGFRLKFDKANTKHQNGCHKFRVPSHKAREDAGFGARRESNNSKSQKQRLCVMHKIANKGYRIDQETWDRIEKLSQEVSGRPVSRGRKDKRGHDAKTDSSSSPGSDSSSACGPSPFTPRPVPVATGQNHGPGTRLSQLRDALQTEVQGEFPIFRLNFFRVYLHSSHSAADIHDVCHESKRENGQHCICYVKNILGAADRVRDHGRTWATLGYTGLLEACEKSITKHFGGKDPDHYLWKAGY